MSFVRAFKYRVDTAIEFGPDAVLNLGETAGAYSDRVFLATMKHIPAVTRVITILKKAGLHLTIFDFVPSNPKTDTVIQAAKMARESKCGVFVGLGGGSAIDTAKAAALMSTHEGNPWEYTVDMGQKMQVPNRPVPPIIAVPTTAGTGSEVSHSASITNADLGRKSPIRSEKIAPRHALIDPKLTITMPKKITADTGFESFCLSFEKFLAVESFPFIDTLAEEAMRGIVKNLNRAIAYPHDLNARSVMLWESTQGGLCDLAGIVGTGLHAFSLPLSALFDVPRGEALALVMPLILDKITELRPHKVARLSRIFDYEPPVIGNTHGRACRIVSRKLNRFIGQIGMKHHLMDYGIGEHDVKDLAASINYDRLATAWGRKVTPSEVEDAYFSLFQGSPDPSRASGARITQRIRS